MTRARDNASNVAGDISGVTAGTGLTGGGSSGALTLSLDTPVSATNGGTAQSTFTTGDILYASAANTLAKLSIGTTSQTLTVSGGIPSWASPSSASLTLSEIASGNLPSSSTLNLTGLTGDYYMIQIHNMNYATALSNMIMQFNSNTGADYASISISTTNADQAIYTAGTSFIIGSTTTVGQTGNENGWIIEIKNSKNNGFHTATWMGRCQISGGGSRAIMGIGYYMNATTITSIQIKIDNGYNFTAGTYKLIGG